MENQFAKKLGVMKNPSQYAVETKTETRDDVLRTPERGADSFEEWECVL